MFTYISFHYKYVCKSQKLLPVNQKTLLVYWLSRINVALKYQCFWYPYLKGSYNVYNCKLMTYLHIILSYFIWSSRVWMFILAVNVIWQ